MTRDDIIRLAREAGIDAEDDTLCRNEGWVEPMVKFAALVIGNHQPQSSMSWQEGYEIGVATEREACAQVCDGWLHADGDRCAEAIRARGQA